MTETTTSRPFDFKSFIVAKGAHSDPATGMCLLEAAAYIAGEPHSDHPVCVDVALAAFGRPFNDRLDDEERQLLKPLIPMLVGTRASRQLAQRRAYLLVDRYLRTIIPAFLRELPHKPQPEAAARLEGMPPVTSAESARQARVIACEVRDAIRSTLSASPNPLRKFSYADAAAADAAAAADYDDAADAAAYAADAAAAAYAAAAYAAAAYAAAAYAAAAYAAADAAAAAAYAADDDDAAYAADADADADADAADAWKALRRRTIERSISSFKEAIELLETDAS